MSSHDAVDIAPAALTQLSQSADLVTDDHWERPSNLAGWSVRDLLVHVIGSITKLGDLIEDRPVDREPTDPAARGEVSREDALRQLAEQTQRAERLLPGAPLESVRRSPMGEVPLGVALRFPLVDAIVHAWDLERSVGRELDLPPRLLAFAQELTDRMNARSDGTVPNFDAPIAAVAGDSPTRRLMKQLGRRAD